MREYRNKLDPWSSWVTGSEPRQFSQAPPECSYLRSQDLQTTHHIGKGSSEDNERFSPIRKSL